MSTAPVPPQPDWDSIEEAAEAEGGPRRGSPAARRRWLVGSLAAVAVLSLLAVWFGISATQGRPTWVDTGFQVTGESTVDVRFDLRRDPDRAVTCELVAQELSHQIVGRTQVEVPPGDASPSRHVATVRTAGPAVAGSVDDCWYTQQGPTP